MSLICITPPPSILARYDRPETHYHRGILGGYGNFTP